MATNSRWVIFLITFISYASTHACRQSFASAKHLLQTHWGFDKNVLGLMDCIWLMSYALGLFSSGVMGDKFDTAKFHSFGLFMTSLIYLLFAISIPYLKLNVNDYQIYYIILWIINGLIQSIGWPSGVKLIGNWFTYSYSNLFQPKSWFIFKGYDNIGLIFGIWAAHQYIGNIIGISYVSIVVNYNLNIQWAFYLPSIQAFIVSIFVFYFVKTYPTHYSHDNNNDNNEKLINEKNNMELKQDNDDDNDDSDNNKNVIKTKYEYSYGVESDSDESVPSIEYRISFKKAIKLPRVLQYGIFYACLKGVNYTIFFWFGYFGSVWYNFNDETSGLFLILFNIGSIIGGWVCGYLTDRYKILSKHGRSPIILLFLILGIPAIFGLYFKPNKYLILYGLLCFTAGFLIGGPTNLISTVMATDIGNKQELHGNPASFSTISGIIDGTGSIGAAISDYTAILINDQYVYLMLAAQLLFGAFLIIPLVKRDLKGIFNRNQVN